MAQPTTILLGNAAGDVEVNTFANGSTGEPFERAVVTVITNRRVKNDEGAWGDSDRIEDKTPIRLVATGAQVDALRGIRRGFAVLVVGILVHRPFKRSEDAETEWITEVRASRVEWIAKGDRAGFARLSRQHEAMTKSAWAWNPQPARPVAAVSVSPLAALSPEQIAALSPEVQMALLLGTKPQAPAPTSVGEALESEFAGGPI